MRRPRFPSLRGDRFLTHAELLAVAEINAQLDQVEKAHARIQSQLRRGVPLDPKLVYSGAEPQRVA